MHIISFSTKIKGRVSKCTTLKIHTLKMVKICFRVTSWVLPYIQATTNVLQNPKRQTKETSDIQTLPGGPGATWTAHSAATDTTEDRG